MLLEHIVVGPLEVNCYLIGSEITREVFIVDPGDDVDEILAVMEKLKAKPIGIINTHAHIDHAGAVAAMKKTLGIPYWLHADDAPLLAALELQSLQFGLFFSGTPQADRFLNDGDILNAGEVSITVLHTPGHSPGSICLLSDGAVLTGDTLFAGSIGRSDLPGGNYSQLMNSLQNKLITLDESLRVCPGHGPFSAIGLEKLHNPFLKGRQ